MSNQEQAPLANTSTDEPPHRNHVTVEIEDVHENLSHDPVTKETPQDAAILKHSSAPSPRNKENNEGARFFGIPPYQSSYPSQSPYTGKHFRYH